MMNNKSLLTFSTECNNEHHFKCTYGDNTNGKITIKHDTVYKKVNHKHIYITEHERYEFGIKY